MHKKIISLVILGSMLMGMFTSVYADGQENQAETTAQESTQTTSEETTEQKSDEIYKKYVELFASVGIDFYVGNASEKMTRCDFAKWLYEFSGDEVELSPIRAKQIFDDVPKSNVDGGYINYISSKGYMKAREGNNFCPNEIITAQEAAYAAIKVLGYDHYYFVNADRYYDLAQSEDLFDRIKKSSISDGMDYEDVVILFYNIANSEVVGVEVDGDGLGLGLNQLYMTKELNLNYISGIMYSNGVTSIKSGVSDIFVTVGNTEFITNEKVNLKGFLGKHVTAYYTVDDYDEKTLVYLLDRGRNETLTIPSDDIETYDDFMYYYHTEDGDYEDVKISKSISIVYNNSVVNSENVNQVDYIPESGYVELVDNNRDDNYDVLFIYDYENFVVGTHNLTYGRLVSKYSDYSIDYLDSNYDIVNWYDGKGNDILPENVVTGQSVSVLKNLDGNMISIYAYTSAVTGIVKGVSTGDNSNLVIESKTYEIAPEKVETLKKISVGQSVTVFVDLFGKVFEINLSTDSSYSMAYLIKAFVDEDTENMVMKFFCSSANAVVTKTVREKVYIDGVTYKSVVAYEDLFIDSNTNKTKYQLFRIKTNSENLITHIDTAKNDTNIFSKSDGSLQAMYLSPTNPQTGAREEIAVANGLILEYFNDPRQERALTALPVAVVPQTVPVMYIPSIRNDGERYQMKTIKDFADKFVLDVYRISSEGIVPDFAVVYQGNGLPEEGSSGGNNTDGIVEETPLSAVVKSEIVVNDANEIVSRLTLITEGVREEVEVNDETLATEIVPVQPGDIIRYCLNGMDKICGIEMVFDRDDIKSENGMKAPNSFNNAYDKYGCVLLNAYYKTEDVVIGVFDKPSNISFSSLQLPEQGQMYLVSEAKRVFYYDKKAKDFVEADESFIKAHINNTGNHSKIVARMQRGSCQDMFIYDHDAF